MITFLKFSVIIGLICSILIKILLALGMGLFLCAWGAPDCRDILDESMGISPYLPEIIVFSGIIGLLMLRVSSKKIIGIIYIIFALILIIPWLYIFNK